MKDGLKEAVIDSIRVGAVRSAIESVCKQIASDPEIVSVTEIKVRQELSPYLLNRALPEDVVERVIGHIKEQHKMLLKAKGYLE